VSFSEHIHSTFQNTQAFPCISHIYSTFTPKNWHQTTFLTPRINYVCLGISQLWME